MSQEYDPNTETRVQGRTREGRQEDNQGGVAGLGWKDRILLKERKHWKGRYQMKSEEMD